MAIGTNPWLVAPIWTTANRPSVVVAGQIGFNLDTPEFEGWDGSAWVSLTGSGGGGGGDNVSVNGTGVSDADFDDATPAAPANSLNVSWQRSGTGPTNISAYFGYNSTNFTVSSSVLTLAALGVGTTHIAGSAVTLAKIQDISSDRLLGRDTAAPGVVEQLTVGGGIEFTGGGGVQTSAFTGDVTKTAGGTVLTIAADAVGSAELAGYSLTVLTTLGYTTVNLPTDCTTVRLTLVGGGGNGNAGVTGDNAANRAGGRGGGSGATTIGTFKRTQLPDTLECFVGDAQEYALVEFVNSSYTGTGSFPSGFSNTLLYAEPGSSVGGAGGGAASSQFCIGMRIGDVVVYVGDTSSTAHASGHPADEAPFGATSRGALSAGCSGAGKSVATDAIGGHYAAAGNFAQRTGGAAAGGAGQDGIFGGGAGTWGATGSTADELAWAYGGTGGGSHFSGTGGDGGDGALGCGGGGGGAGTTAGGAGGAGGQAYILVETW
jgi:hypothetical protein